MESLTLQDYHPTGFDHLNAWVTDADLLFRFAGSEFTFPLTEAQVTAYQSAHPDRIFYFGCMKGLPFAFGEIIPQDAVSVRLGRLLVGDPEYRGRGLGAAFIHLLLEAAAMRFCARRVDLYVWEKNERAIHCYRSCGFLFCDEAPLTIRHRDTDYLIRKMSRPVAPA